MNNLNHGNYKLVDAIISNDLLEVKVLISQGVDVNQSDLNDDFTPLMRAINLDSIEIVKLLLTAGAGVNLSPSPDKTALGLAISNGNLEMVKLLLEAGANPDRGGCVEPLISAVSTGNIDIVLVLLEEGANTSSNLTPLMAAASKGDLTMVKFLVDLRENVNKTDEYGETALKIAASNGHEEVYSYLYALTAPELRKEAEDVLPKGIIYCQRLSNKFTEDFIEAAARGNVNAVINAIKNGVNIDAFGVSESTALYIAANWGHISVVRVLVEAGANLELGREDDFETPLMAAAGKLALAKSNFGSPEMEKNLLEIISLLIDAGANVNAENNEGDTALSCAKAAEHPEIVQLLLDAGAMED